MDEVRPRITAARAHRLALIAAFDPRNQSAIGNYHFAPGEVRTLTHDFTLFASRVQLIDADSGAALTNTEFVTERINGQGVIGKTDADGWLELNLPPGDYALSTWQVEPMRSATLRWTAVGPSEDRLELHVPE